MSDAMASEPIHLEIRDGLAWLTLDDGRANAIGSTFCQSLAVCLDRIEADDDVFAVVVKGRPGFFSGGLDLKELPDLAPDALSDMLSLFMTGMRRLFLFPKPMVAAADGHAIAGGMMLYLTADIRLSTTRPGARFGLNEATTGIPLVGGTAGICRHGIPTEHHTEVILHGRMLDARGTAERGITHELVGDATALASRAEARARELEDLSLSAYRLNKRMLREQAWNSAVRLAESLADEVPRGNVFEGIRR